MNPETAHALPVTLLPTQPPHLALVMHRLDEHSAQLKELRGDVNEIRADLSALRLETKTESTALRAEIKTESAALRAEIKTESSALRAEFRDQVQALRKEMKEDLREIVTAAIAPLNERFKTYDERLDKVATQADNRLLRWCAGSAAGSSTLAYVVARLLS